MQIFVNKVMSLLFKMLSRFVTAFPSKKQASFVALIVSRDFGAQENKICHCFYFCLEDQVKMPLFCTPLELALSSILTLTQEFFSSASLHPQ